MKKYLSLSSALFLIVSMAHSQAEYKFIDFKDAQRPAISVTLPYPEKIVDGALQDKMSKLGYKGKEAKGFKEFKGVTIPELGSGTYDLYFAIDKKSKKEKDAATITMLVSKGNEVFVTEAEDTQTIAKAKQMLNNLHVGVAAYDLEQQISEQESVVKKEEKRLKGYVNDGEDLQKRKKKLEQQIEQNQKDQSAEEKEIQKQKDLYEILKARRKK